MKRILSAAAVALALGGAVLIAGGGPASAHFTSVSCQSPGTWLIVNSESGLSMTFTTSAGHSGSIAAGGSTTVSFSGNSLTVSGVWSDGFQTSNSGEGNCTVTTTTQPEVTTSTPTTTTAPTTTVPAGTTTTSSPPVTTPTTSTTSPAQSSSTSPPSTPTSSPSTSTDVVTTSSPPVTTEPCVPLSQARPTDRNICGSLVRTL